MLQSAQTRSRVDEADAVAVEVGDSVDEADSSGFVFCVEREHIMSSKSSAMVGAVVLFDDISLAKRSEAVVGLENAVLSLCRFAQSVTHGQP